MSCKKRRYPYLSIDQIQKSFNQTKIVPKSTLSTFFNIKFDINNPHSTDRVNTSPVISKQNSISKIQPIFSNEEKQKQYEKIYFLAKSGKKRHSTEKMLESITKLIQKEESMKKALQESLKRKTKQLSFEQKKTQKSQIQQNDVYLLHTKHREPRPLFEKGRQLNIHKMLRKCEQLKQIERFEHQLTRQNSKGEELPCIRFNTEPLSIPQFQKQLKQKIYTPKKPNINKRLFHKNSSSPTASQDNTLEIRKYVNQSVIKNRIKNMIKKDRLQMEQKRVSEIMGLEKNNKTMRKNKKVKTCESEEREFVGPWMQPPQSQFQFK